MRINLRNIAVLLLVYCLSAMSSYATKLPPYVLSTIKTELPNASIRFDGLVTLPDGTIYLPVLPSNPPKKYVGKIISTYPSNKKLSQLPEVVLFDSNFAFLKVIKTTNGKITVTDTKNIPFVVKTGLFPQDMLVPPGLVVPEDMKIMMGDLVVNVKNSRVDDIFREHSLINKSAAKIEQKIKPVSCLLNKTFLVTALDSKIVNVIPSDTTVPKYTFRMENLPKFVEPFGNDRYLLVAAAGKTYVEVADIEQEVIAKKIDLSYQPSEVVFNKDKTRAYIAVLDDQSIFVLDTKNMTLLEKIKVKGYPKNISLNDDCSAMVYSDRNTGDIYTLALDETYLNKYVYNASNIAKLALRGDNVYILSRTENELQVVDNELQDIIYNQPLAKKPVDMLVLNGKIYVLCASNELDIFNLSDYSINAKVTIPGGGFSKKLIKVQDADYLLITNLLQKKYFVFDMKTNSIINSVSLPVVMSDFQLLNRRVK